MMAELYGKAGEYYLTTEGYALRTNNRIGLFAGIEALDEEYPDIELSCNLPELEKKTMEMWERVVKAKHHFDRRRKEEVFNKHG